MHRASVLLPTLVHGLHVAARGSTQKWLRTNRYTAAPAVELTQATIEVVTILQAIEAVATTRVGIDKSAASLLALPKGHSMHSSPHHYVLYYSSGVYMTWSDKEISQNYSSQLYTTCIVYNTTAYLWKVIYVTIVWLTCTSHTGESLCMSHDKFG